MLPTNETGASSPRLTLRARGSSFRAPEIKPRARLRAAHALPGARRLDARPRSDRLARVRSSMSSGVARRRLKVERSTTPGSAPRRPGTPASRTAHSTHLATPTTGSQRLCPGTTDFSSVLASSGAPRQIRLQHLNATYQVATGVQQ